MQNNTDTPSKDDTKSENKAYKIKMVLLGDVAVGKTSIANRYV